VFALYRQGTHFRATGLTPWTDAGALASLGDGAARLLAHVADGRPRVVVGALPFDPDTAASLFLPSHWQAGAGSPFPTDRAAIRAPGATPVPEPAAFETAVRQALAAVEAGVVSKVVLARGLSVTLDGAVPPATIAGRLSQDPTVTTYLLDLPGSDRSFLGATPELLVSRRDRAVASNPLAGSTARRADPVVDREAAAALIRSDKDRREHALVVEAVLDTLAPHCVALAHPGAPVPQATATMWHLGSRVAGTLKPDAPSALGLAALLHPTPAVGGNPRDAALALIRELEPDRGLYAGAVGWTDDIGDGEWHVSLRCAQVAGNRLMLHAGAGIVAGSDPAAELAETAAKFRAMLRALDLDGEALTLDAAA
jgi:isochorismate synthase